MSIYVLLSKNVIIVLAGFILVYLDCAPHLYYVFSLIGYCWHLGNDVIVLRWSISS